jgi:hypothetical protein
MMCDTDFNSFCLADYKTFKSLPKDVIFCFTKETSFRINEYLDFYKGKIEKLKKKKNITIIFDTSYLPYKDLLNIKNVRIIYIDWFAIDVYRKQVIEKLTPVQEYVSAVPNGKFLCLVGKSDRIHRIESIYKLWKNNLLANSKYSFRFNNKEKSKKLLSNMSDWKLFQKQIPNDLDFKYPTENFHYTGIPFNPNIYKNVNFQFVIESEYKLQHSWLTEKTWIPILNSKPFIALGNRYDYKRLEDLGFDTYKKFLLYPNFHQEENLSKRINKAILNIEHWIDNLHTFNIEESVNHNRTQMEKLIEINIKRIDELDLDIDPFSIGLPYLNMKGVQSINYVG